MTPDIIFHATVGLTLNRKYRFLYLEKRVNTKNCVLHTNSVSSNYLVRLIANVANETRILDIGVQNV